MCFAEVLGLPPSLGRLYGFIFARERGITADDCTTCLGLSRSGAGQGLKVLLELGAIQRDRSVHQRKDAYRLEPDLGLLLGNLLQRRLAPGLQELDAQLERARAACQADDKLLQRLEKLERWQNKAQPILEMLRALPQQGALGGAPKASA